MDIVKIENLKELIIEVRGQSVLLDSDVAQIYGVETKGVTQRSVIMATRSVP